MQIAGKSDSCSGHDLSGLTQLMPPGRAAGSINSLARSAPMFCLKRICYCFFSRVDGSRQPSVQFCKSKDEIDQNIVSKSAYIE